MSEEDAPWDQTVRRRETRCQPLPRVAPISSCWTGRRRRSIEVGRNDETLVGSHGRKRRSSASVIIDLFTAASYGAGRHGGAKQSGDVAVAVRRNERQHDQALAAALAFTSGELRRSACVSQAEITFSMCGRHHARK